MIEFLDKLSDMMMDEVSKHWPRFKEYFELWIELTKENTFVQRYCSEKMMIEKILDFIMEDSYPYMRKHKRHPMGNQYYSPEFEFPLEFMYTLQQEGYELNDMEKHCMKTYSFMDKIIGFRI